MKVLINPYSSLIVGKPVELTASMNGLDYYHVINILKNLGYTTIHRGKAYYKLNPDSNTLAGKTLKILYLSQKEFTLLSEILPHISYSITKIK